MVKYNSSNSPLIVRVFYNYWYYWHRSRCGNCHTLTVPWSLSFYGNPPITRDPSELTWLLVKLETERWNQWNLSYPRSDTGLRNFSQSPRDNKDFFVHLNESCPCYSIFNFVDSVPRKDCGRVTHRKSPTGETRSHRYRNFLKFHDK